MERSHRKYNSGRHTAFSISGIPRLGAGSLLVLIFSAFKLISAAPSFAVSKDGVMCGWYRISFCKAKFTLLRDKTKAQAVESSVSHPFQNRERDGAASVGMRAGKSKTKDGPAPILDLVSNRSLCCCDCRPRQTKCDKYTSDHVLRFRHRPISSLFQNPSLFHASEAHDVVTAVYVDSFASYA